MVSAIVLAAGASSRMGSQKALMPFAGSTLIDYQLAQLTSIAAIAEVVVVTGDRPERIAERIARYDGVREAHNPAYATGKVSSIMAGVRAASPRANSVLLIAVDQPRPARIIDMLVRGHVASRALISVPTAGGRRGHPVLCARDVVPDLLSMSEESQGLRAVLARHVARVQEIPIEDPRVLVDLNEPADIEAAGSFEW
jgi:molybdenum cofactor cytidylyltransferase